MKKAFLVLALAAALALSFALVGCSNSGPKSGAEPGDVVENMDKAEKAESSTDKTPQQPQPGFDVEKAVFDNGLGDLVDYYSVELENGEYGWGVITHDVNHNEVTTYFDNKGNIISGGLERGDDIDDSAAGPSFDVEQVVFDNGLGDLVDYYSVQGEDGEIYWGVVTHDVNHNEVTTYFDSNGNMTGEMERGDDLN